MRRKRRESFWVERKEMKDDTILWANLFSSPLFSFLFRMDFSFSQREGTENLSMSPTHLLIVSFFLFLETRNVFVWCDPLFLLLSLSSKDTVSRKNVCVFSVFFSSISFSFHLENQNLFSPVPLFGSLTERTHFVKKIEPSSLRSLCLVSSSFFF